jgi:CDP-diglyceride synthetase
MVVFNESDIKKKSFFGKIINLFVILKTKKSDLYQRVIIASCLAIAALFLTIMGGFWFNAGIIAMGILSTIELTNMIHVKQMNENSSEDNSDILHLKRLTVPYILIPMLSIIFIREATQGLPIIIWFLLSIWSVDTAGYIVGNLFGKNKLYPSISPNKTIEGALGGILAGLVITVILFPIMSITIGGSNGAGFSFYSMIFLSLVVSVLSIIGDLFESYIKRQCGVKDSGNLLLSHGGMMDRTDSIVFTAPIIAILVILKKGIFF